MSDPDIEAATIPPEPVRVVLVNEERFGDAPFNVRLRRALKCLLRGFGLRCTSIGPDRPEPTTENESPMNSVKTVIPSTTAGFKLWHRPNRKSKWRAVATLNAENEATNAMEKSGIHHGQWLTTPAGQDANARRSNA